MKQEDCEFFFNQSKQKYESGATSYDEAAHRDWADEENWGVTHFGITPNALPLDSMRFDVFHMSCAILRKVMYAVRDCVNSMSTELKMEFTDDVLRTFFGAFHLYCWNCNFSFSRLQGKELFRFLDNIGLVTTFLTNRMGESRRVKTLVEALNLLPRMIKFLCMSYINETDEEYLTLLHQFSEDTRNFIKNGRLTFLIDEQDETFYVHTLCYYMPVHAKITFERHRLGLGIFTMQGFERRNKESKNCIKRFSTGNRNCFSFLVNNMRRLLIAFLHEVKAY